MSVGLVTLYVRWTRNLPTGEGGGRPWRSDRFQVGQIRFCRLTGESHDGQGTKHFCRNEVVEGGTGLDGLRSINTSAGGGGEYGALVSRF